jgi:hypothetical protein
MRAKRTIETMGGVGAGGLAPRALVALFTSLGLHCSSKAIDDGALFRQYSTERTLIVTGSERPNEEGCGAPQAPVSGEAALRYEVTNQGGNVRVTELVGGCVLHARVEGDVVIADNQACTLRDDAPLRRLGVTSRVYGVFRLDAGQKTVVSRALTVATVTTGESRSCSVSEERIVETP